MNKMLYIMGVEWGWILQRPQILALALNKKYHVTVVAPKQLFHHCTVHENPNMEIRDLLQLPLQEKIRIIRWISDLFNCRVFRDYQNYDIIWVGYPLFQRYIPSDYKGIIIYDCMDNHEMLFPDRSRRAICYLRNMERELIKRAGIIFASSQKLREKLSKEYGVCNVEVIRNGHKEKIVHEVHAYEMKKNYVLGYIGTISEWMDMDVLKSSIDKQLPVIYKMVGPVLKKIQIPSDKIQYTGAIKHDELYEYVQTMDCLLMPFIVNGITIYVDPVKLYEYIAWGKCIVSVYYPELEYFSDFVYFYHSTEEYVALIRLLIQKGFPPKYTKEQQVIFLQRNTWENRVQEILERIELYEENQSEM